MPPALMAATPVGAVMTIRLEFSSLIWCRNVVLPVPALPVRKIFLPVLRTYSNARSNWGLETKLMAEVCHLRPPCGVPCCSDQDRNDTREPRSVTIIESSAAKGANTVFGGLNMAVELLWIFRHERKIREELDF